MKKSSPVKQSQLVPFNTTYFVSARQIADICHVDITTARRYRRTARAPRHVAELLDLYGQGRVLPESWGNCFVNGKGELEIGGIGVITEQEIVNSRWLASVSQQRIEHLESELQTMRRKVSGLEEHLDAARAAIGSPLPANSHSYWRLSK